jgi:hypothetical protein
MAKRVVRQDSASEQVPTTLTQEEEMLAKLAEKNTKFERNELVVPRLKVLQQLNPEVQEGGPQYVPNAKAGMFYNTSSNKLTPGQEGLILCVIGHQKQTIQWVSNNPGSGMVKIWGTDEGWKALCEPAQREALNPITRDGNYIDKQRSFLILDVNTKTGETDPSFFNLRSTGNRVANLLSTMLTQTRIKLGNGQTITPPFYYFTYKMTLDLLRNTQGQSWWSPKIVKNVNEKNMHVRTQDLPNGEEIFKQAILLQEHFLEGDIQQQTDWEQPQDDLGGDKIPAF